MTFYNFFVIEFGDSGTQPHVLIAAHQRCGVYRTLDWLSR